MAEKTHIGGARGKKLPLASIGGTTYWKLNQKLAMPVLNRGRNDPEYKMPGNDPAI